MRSCGHARPFDATRGMPVHLVQHLTHEAVFYQRGVFAGTNDAVEPIGGSPG